MTGRELRVRVVGRTCETHAPHRRHVGRTRTRTRTRLLASRMHTTSHNHTIAAHGTHSSELSQGVHCACGAMVWSLCGAECTVLPAYSNDPALRHISDKTYYVVREPAQNSDSLIS